MTRYPDSMRPRRPISTNERHHAYAESGVRVSSHSPGWRHRTKGRIAHRWPTIRTLSGKLHFNEMRVLRPSECLIRITGHWPVGSRTGAVFRRSGLSVCSPFPWECLTSRTVNPFPAPATSHPACGFPALGAPVCLVPRVMWPIVPERLSRLTIDVAGSR